MPLHELPLADMKKIESRITKDVFGVLSVETFGEEPRELRRHRAEERARAGEEMAQEAGKGAVSEVLRRTG